MPINTDDLLDLIAEQLAPRLEAIGERIAEKARAKAPVGHGERQGVAEAIKVRGGTRGFTASQIKMLAEIGGSVPEEVFRQHIAKRGSKSELQVQHEFAKLFRFAKGGGTPERVELRGRGTDKILRGFRQTKPHLRDTIKSEGVTREGNTLHLVVAARSDHAYQVEKGFHHKGGGQIPGRPFLYPAWDSEKDGLADGSSLKG